MDDKSLDTHLSDVDTCHNGSNNEDLNEDDDDDRDHVLDGVNEFVSLEKSAPRSDGSLKAETDDSPQVNISSQFLSIPHGLIPGDTYEHGKMNTEITGVIYNERMRQFVILDAKGITTWKRDAVDARVHRALSYHKYEYRLITNVVYAKKYNCYFILGKDFSLKVYNRDFVETCSVSADLRSVLFMLFNPVRDELLTGGVGGTKVWDFHQQPINAFSDLKTHVSCGLTLKYELPNVGGSWVKRVDLDHQLEHLYFCSDHDLFVYDLSGKLLLKFERSHSMSITGCRYSRNASVLVTSSLDSEVKVWSLVGGLVHTFRGHSRAVTNLVLHPITSSIVVTCSLDGTVRMWSLDTMDCLYSLVVSTDGLQWMGLTDDNLLYLSTPTTMTLWHMNYSVQFWALARSQVNRFVRCGYKGKTTRIMAISEDSSVRLMARSNSKSLTTVLPPPNISPLHQVLSVCYSREFNIIYMLINSHEIWVYTVRTDPACRIDVWHMTDIQRRFTSEHSKTTPSSDHRPITSANKSPKPYKVTESGARNESLVKCCCIVVLASPVIMWTDEGYCCPIRDSFLLAGLEDGRIIFMDPVVKGHKYLELKTGKNTVLDMNHDVAHNGLVTLHKLKDRIQIQMWCVPDLTLQYEVCAAADLQDFARERNILVTGHESGCVIFHTLEPGSAQGHKTKTLANEEVLNVKHKPEHLAPVIAVDVCAALKLVCSCSDDGAIKIWHDRVLLTEIVVDSSLSAVCFLNNRGDLLVGYQKHMFYIDRTKVCPQLTVPESDVDNFEKESYICEDPSVLYEGVTSNHEQVTMESYLVPFDIEISKDFRECRVTLEHDVKDEEVSDDGRGSQISVAPTDIYLSPVSTPPRRLSLVDHLLSSEINKYDLLNHMKRTLDHLAEKEKQDAAQLPYEQRLDIDKRAFRHHKRFLNSKKSLEDNKSEKIKGKRDGRRGIKVKAEKVINATFCFPRVGESPRLTPESSAPNTPEHFSESEEELKELDVTPDEVGEQMVVMKDIGADIFEVSKFQETENKEEPNVKVTTERFTTKTKFGLSHIRVDAQFLMKNTNNAGSIIGAPKRRSDPEPIQAQKVLEYDYEKKSGCREVHMKKKMLTASQRKSIKSGKTEKLEKMESKDEPLLQVETDELEERETNNCLDASLDGEDKLYSEQEETDASYRLSKEMQSSSSSASSLGKATREDISASNILVPPLPCVHVAVSHQDLSRPSTTKSRSERTAISAPLSMSNVSYYSNRQDGTSESDDAERIWSRSSGDNSNALTADIAIKVDDISVTKTGSKDGSSSSRLRFCPNEKSVVEDFQDGASPYIADQSGTYDSSWMTKDLLSQSTYLPESHNHSLDTMGGLSEHNILEPGTILVSQVKEQTTVQLRKKTNTDDLPSASAIETAKTTPWTSVEERILGKPELEDVVRYFQQRPQTAQMRFSTEDSQTVTDASMVKYKPKIRSNLTADKLCKNHDQDFSQNWHDRQIERHILLRKQEELRSQNVHTKRQMMHQTRQDYLKQSNREDHVTIKRNSSPHALQSPNQRAATVHGSRPAQSTLRPTSTSSRPHTASVVYDQYRLQSQSPPKLQSFLTVQQQVQQRQKLQTRLKQVKMCPHGQAGLRYEKPFRCRLQQLREPQIGELHMNSDLSLPIGPQWIDPRNPNAVRPKSSKSIPSKCRRFVLVTKSQPKEDVPLPTPLERYLLTLRLPVQRDRIFKRLEKLLSG